MTPNVKFKPLSIYWLVQVNRDFRTHALDQEIRLYHRVAFASIDYTIVCFMTRSEKNDGSIIVEASNGQSYILIEEPHIDSWKASIYASWLRWDASNGASLDTDRCDYEPCAYLTREACLAGASDQFYRGD